MRKAILYIFGLLVFAAPAAVQAWDCCGCEQDLYVRAFGGAQWPSKIDFGGHNCNQDGSGNNRHNKAETGWVVGGAIGTKTCWCVRLEAEVSYRYNDLKKHKRHHTTPPADGAVVAAAADPVVVATADVAADAAPVAVAADVVAVAPVDAPVDQVAVAEIVDSNGGSGSHNRRGHFDNVAFLVNAIYDIDLDSCGCSCFKPYVGVGIGYAHSELHRKRNHQHNGDLGSVESCHRNKHKKNGFAWQVIVGTAYPFSDCLDLFVEYRYFSTNVKNYNDSNVVVGAKWGF